MEASFVRDLTKSKQISGAGFCCHSPDHAQSEAGTGDQISARLASQLTIYPSTEGCRDGRIDDDVRHIQERHDGAERRNVVVVVLELGQRRLDVGRQRAVTACPAKGYWYHTWRQKPRCLAR